MCGGLHRFIGPVATDFASKLFPLPMIMTIMVVSDSARIIQYFPPAQTKLCNASHPAAHLAHTKDMPARRFHRIVLLSGCASPQVPARTITIRIDADGATRNVRFHPVRQYAGVAIAGVSSVTSISGATSYAVWLRQLITLTRVRKYSKPKSRSFI